jgi:hypothetical protein
LANYWTASDLPEAADGFAFALAFDSEEIRYAETRICCTFGWSGNARWYFTNAMIPSFGTNRRQALVPYMHCWQRACWAADGRSAELACL